jgi:hypothetical protein
MVETICLIVGAYLGFHVGSMYMAFKLRHLLLKEAEANGSIVIDKPPKPNLVVEHNDNMLYLYDSQTNTFICQGKTLEELALLSKQYSNITDAMVLDTKSNNIVTFSDGRIV